MIISLKSGVQNVQKIFWIFFKRYELFKIFNISLKVLSISNIFLLLKKFKHCEKNLKTLKSREIPFVLLFRIYKAIDWRLLRRRYAENFKIFRGFFFLFVKWCRNLQNFVKNKHKTWCKAKKKCLFSLQCSSHLFIKTRKDFRL